MKKTFLLSLLITTAALASLTHAREGDFAPGEVIVRYKPAVGAQSINVYADILEQANVDYDYQEKLWENTFLVKLTRDNAVASAAGSLAADSNVIYAEPNFIDKIFLTPNDPRWDDLWGLRKIRADTAWDTQSGSANVTVAVVDTGVDPNHPDLQGKLLQGYDFVGNDSNPSDVHGHGTHVAGTIGAITNNSQNVAGVAGGDTAQNNLGVQILPLRACDSRGSCRVDRVGRAIRYAVDNGAHVINMSLGGSDSQTYRDTITHAVQNGVVVVGAAGNDGTNRCAPPANYDNNICVIATNRNDQRASLSNYGRDSDVAAPGVGIVSLRAGGGVTRMSGTSMAAPHVAGLAGLLYSFMPSRSTQNAQTVRGCVENNLDVPQGWNSNWAPGRVNALKAVNDGSCNTGVPTPTTGPTNTPTPPPLTSITPTATSPPLPQNCSQADLNLDNQIDQNDLQQLINAYGQNRPDINGDGLANQIDASIILACWN